MRSDPPHVLIVNTSNPIRKSLGTFLASAGYSIVEAVRGEEALRLIRTELVDAVFLEVSLPGKLLKTLDAQNYQNAGNAVLEYATSTRDFRSAGFARGRCAQIHRTFRLCMLS